MNTWYSSTEAFRVDTHGDPYDKVNQHDTDRHSIPSRHLAIYPANSSRVVIPTFSLPVAIGDWFLRTARISPGRIHAAHQVLLVIGFYSSLVRSIRTTTFNTIITGLKIQIA